MIESIMLIGLGFLAAALFALLLAPPFWRRAVRITTRRIQSRSPLTMAEIQAERDQMRAEFAQTTRKLEVVNEQLKKKTVDQSVALARFSEKANVLSTKAAEQERTLKDRNAELARLRESVAPLQSELAEKRIVIDKQENELRSLREAREKADARVREMEIKVREAEKFVERKDREIDRLRKARVAGKAVPAKRRRKDPEREALAERIDKLAVRADDLRERLAALRERGKQLKSAKRALDSRRVVKHEDLEQHKAAVRSFEDERNRLTAELADTVKALQACEKEIAERDAAWQQDSANPFIEMRRTVDAASASLDEEFDAFDSEVRPDDIRTSVEADKPAPAAQAASAANGPEPEPAQNGGEAPARKRSWRGTSLAERIRALQDQITH